MSSNLSQELLSILYSLKGIECWYVSCESIGTTIQLTFGDRIRRARPLKNPHHSEEFRVFQGEISLLVWCVWRLDGQDGALTSWDDQQESVATCLKRLVGARIESIETMQPMWDLSVSFTNKLCLRVFCDHVPGDPSFDRNWTIRTKHIICAVGPGTKLTTEPL